MFFDMEIPADSCAVCLVAHDDEIHAATLSVHEWLRSQVTRWLGEEELEQTAA